MNVDQFSIEFCKLGNRDIINDLDFNFHVNMTDDQIRINLEKALNMCFFQNGPRDRETNLDKNHEDLPTREP